MRSAIADAGTHREWSARGMAVRFGSRGRTGDADSPSAASRPWTAPRSRYGSATLIPSCTKRWTTARPNAPVPPVTSAVRPAEDEVVLASGTRGDRLRLRGVDVHGALLALHLH